MRTFLLVISLRGSTAPPPRDAGFAADKVQHFFSSAFVQSLSYGVLRGIGVRHDAAIAGATVTTAAVGVGKEVHDARTKGDPSVRDLLWDAAGAASVTLLLVRNAR